MVSAAQASGPCSPPQTAPRLHPLPPQPCHPRAVGPTLAVDLMEEVISDDEGAGAKGAKGQGRPKGKKRKQQVQAATQ